MLKTGITVLGSMTKSRHNHERRSLSGMEMKAIGREEVSQWRVQGLEVLSMHTLKSLRISPRVVLEIVVSQEIQFLEEGMIHNF